MPIEILEQRIAPATVLPISVLVTNLRDSGPGTLRSAILAIDANAPTGNGANTIIFANTLKGQIVLHSPLPAITEPVSIGGVTSAKITINGDDHFQIFNIQGNTINVTLSDLTLTNGNSLNETTGKTIGGGALYVSDYGGTVKLANSTITHNMAFGLSGAKVTAGEGGGIFLESGTLEITNSKITGNTATGGHGTTIGATGPTAQMGGRAAGAGIYSGSNGILDLTSSTVSGNIARGGAGTPGVRGAAGTASTAAGNGQRGGAGGQAEGGGVWSYGTGTIVKSTISGNVVIGGRGASGGAGGNAFAAAGGNGGNGGSGGYGGEGLGGGIYCSGSYQLLLSMSTVSGNVADGNFSGAGMPGGLGAPGQHAGHRGISGAHTDGYGGGLRSYETTLLMVDSTIAHNVADKGGGLSIYQNSQTQLDNSTIAFNGARRTGYGGGLWTYTESNETFVVISTVIADNAAGTHAKPGNDVYVDVLNGLATISTYSSLIESYNSYNDGSGTLQSTIAIPYPKASPTLLGINPFLGPLRNNGGTTLTCEPNPNSSPLLGAGTTPQDLANNSELTISPTLSVPYDQRGHERNISGTVDIGAVEIA